MPDKEKMSMKEAWHMIMRALGMLWNRFRYLMILMVAVKAVETLIPYITVWFSAQIINELAGDRNVEVLRNQVVILLVVEAFLGALHSVLKRIKTGRFYVFMEQKEQFYMDKFFSMDFVSVDSSKVQDLYSQIKQNDHWSRKGIVQILMDFENLAGALFGMIGGMVLSWSLFSLKVPEAAGKLTVLNHFLFLILFLVFMGMATFGVSYASTKGGSYWDRSASAARLGNRVYSFFGYLGYKRERALDMRLYRQEKICRNSLQKNNIFGLGSKIAGYAKGPMGLFYMLSAMCSRLFHGIIFLFVGLKAWGGAFGIGLVTQYLSAVTLLFDSVSSVLGILGEMKNNAAFLKPVFEFLDIPNDMYQGSLTVEKRNDCQYEVEFKHVSFKYPGTENYVLKDICVKFQVGKKLAVVGENGSGKTTFIKLLCRLYDPTEGEILLNGINIRKYDYREYMSVFSVVFQDFKLPAFTLGENVAASAEYDREKATECLEKSGLKERLAEMSQGLDTWLYKDLDEKGVEVSGGEAQKIAIARALYKDAAFLILDEPTAALDPVAEYEIYTKFNEIAGERTAVYISHRLSSCKFCDEILVFQEGRVVQHGNHESLVAEEKGRYHELWNAQAQYYVESAGACS